MKLFKNLFEFKKAPDFINDRRDSKRYDIMLKLNYSCPETKYSEESLTKNISKNGLRFQVNSRLPKGSLLDIQIEDPNSNKSMLLRGRVVWLEEFSGEEDSEAIRYETGVNLLKKKLF
ncbi:MAG: PilZ domain-containing protein [Candidatus Omnitrophota bacterium]|nr:PilZ domain-containing protein [Candidatus Omnitrophota bacterium]